MSTSHSVGTQQHLSVCIRVTYKDGNKQIGVSFQMKLTRVAKGGSFSERIEYGIEYGMEYII